MSLTVIIPSRTTTNVLRAIEALRAHDPDVPVVVVDDGIEHEVVGRHATILPGVKPFVFARNVNIGIRAAGADDVVVLNDDALLTCGSFRDLQAVAIEHPEFGLLSAVTETCGEPLQHPAGHGLRELPRMVCFVAVLIPRVTLERVGLLDEDFTGYGFEDDAYCYRVRQAGYKLGVYDFCYVDHRSLPSSFRAHAYPSTGFEHNRQVFIEKFGAYPL